MEHQYFCALDPLILAQVGTPVDHMHAHLRLLLMAPLSGGALLLLLQTCCKAQEPDEASKFLKATNTITKSQVSWRRFVATAPQSASEVEEMMEKLIAKARQSGDTKEQIAIAERAERDFARRSKQGSTHVSTLNFFFDGKRVLGDSTQLGFVPFGSESVPVASKDQTIRAVDYFDGENIVNMNKMGVQYPDSGVVSRRADLNLKLTSPGYLSPQFLFGKPFDDAFGSKAIIVERGSDNVLIRKQLTEGIYKDYVAFLRISQKFGRPTEFFISTGNKQENKIIHLETADWKKFSEVWFPQRVTIDLAPHQKANSNTETYKLISAAFNSAADVSALDKAVRPKTTLNDHRFAPRIGVRYVVRKQLPPNATILQMVEKREGEEKELERQNRMSAARNIALPIGALFMVGGLIWFRRSRQNKA